MGQNIFRVNLVVRDFKGVENLSRYNNVISKSSALGFIYIYIRIERYFLFIILTFPLERMVWKRFVFDHFFFPFLSFSPRLLFFLLRVYAGAVI